MGWRDGVAAAGELLLGACCPGCRGAWWGVCPECRDALGRLRPRLTAPDPCPPGFPLAASGGPYDRLLRGLLVAHKEEQAWTLTGCLSHQLAGAVALLLDVAEVPGGRPLVLVPVPSARAVVRERGRDATLALARAAARRLRPSRPVRAVRLLSQRRAVRDQAGLAAEQRRANLAGSLRTSGRVPDAAVVVVDDVVTTGSSVTEAVRVLRAAGVEVVGAATVAATVRRRPSRPPGLARGGPND